MATTIRKVGYFKLSAPNKPGVGALLLQTLREGGVNLLAMTAFPAGKGCQVDLVPEKAAKLQAVAKQLGAKLSKEKTGFLVQGKDGTGVLLPILQTLGDAGISITAIDAVSAGKKRYGAIFWVQPKEVAKAAKLLKAK